jgi:hypothetical protein
MREGTARWIERLNRGCLAGLLIAFPLWQYWVLSQRSPESIFLAFRAIILYASDILWWAFLGTWALSYRLRNERERLRLAPLFMTGPLVGLLALGVVSVPFAVAPAYAGYHALRLFLLLASYLAMANASTDVEIVAWSLAAGVVLQAGVALTQFVLGRSLGLNELGEPILDPAQAGVSVVMVGEQRWLRAYGLTLHPNVLGGYLMFSLLVIAAYSLSQSGRKRFLLLVVYGMGLAALLVTFSRAAWLGTMVGGLGMLTLLVLERKEQPLDWGPVGLLAAVALGVVVVFVATCWPLLMPRLGLVSQGVEIRSLEERVLLAKAAWSLIRLRPVLGVGLGNFSIALYQLAPETVAVYRTYQPVHNVALLTVAELGPLGGALWLGLILAPWAALLLGRRRVSVSPWLAGLSGALAALAVVSCLDHYVWSFHQGALMQWLVWGLWAREWNRLIQSKGEEMPG